MNVPEVIPLVEGLELRRWRRADAEALDRAVGESREHLLRWLPWAASTSVVERWTNIARWEREWETGGDFVWGLFESGRVMGGFGLHRRSNPDGLEIGYWVHVERARRGYATRAAAALTSVAFTIPGVAVVEIKHDKRNVASAGIPRKLGFRLTGERSKEPEAPANEPWSLVTWTMTREAWTSRHQSGEITSPVGTLG